MKKLSVILLETLLCICFALLPTEAQAATEGYLTYTVKDGQVTIMECDKNASGKIVIPGTIEGYPVTAIRGYAFSDCNSVSSITVPAGVEKIGTLQCVASIWVDENNPYLTSDSKGAVYSKDMKTLFGVPASLTGVYTVPDGVQTIESRAFAMCANLTQIVLPESVTLIKDGAFAWCKKLESVNIPAGVQSLGGTGGYVFMECTSLKSITIPYGVTEIPNSTFQECTALEIAELPETVTAIGYEAFDGCISLKTVDISHATTIGDLAFSGCESLNDITLAEGLTVIEYDTFWGCSSLTSIQIPSTVTEIADGAFRKCTSLRELHIPAGVLNLGGDATAQEAFRVAEDNPNYSSDSFGVLYNKKKTRLIRAPLELSGHYTIPEGVTEIASCAFSECKNLTGVDIPDSVITISSNAFSSCKNLTNVDIPDSVATIGSHAFAYSGLTEVPVFKSVTISYGTFQGCTGLVSAKIPEGVQEIWSNAFEDCTSLTTVILPSTIQKIGIRAFEDCPALTKVISYVGKDKIEIENSVYADDYILNAEWIVHTCTWDDGIIVGETTCLQEGVKEYTCTQCGRKMEKTIEALPHELEETWSFDEAMHWRTCTVCNKKLSHTSHTPGLEATETETQNCIVCGYELAPKRQPEPKPEPISKKQIPSYWIWIIAGVVVLAGDAAVTVILWKKKQK